MQYIRQANDKFRYRFNNYNDKNQESVRSEDQKQEGFFAHFQTAGYSDFINDSDIRFINEMDPSDCTKCEHFYIDTFKTFIF